MRKSFVLVCGALFLAMSVLFCSVCSAEDVTQLKNGDVGQMDLKKQCMEATITAINLEIERYQRWINFRQQQGDQTAVVAYSEYLALLQSDRDKFMTMDSKDYVLPEKLTAVAWTTEKAGANSVLYVDNMSKNGPWYHLAGVSGGDYSVLKQNSKYDVVIYPVYTRSYWNMDSAYVYVAQINSLSNKFNKSLAQNMIAEKRIVGEVLAQEYRAPLYDLVKCEAFQVFLLEDNQPSSASEMLLDSKQYRFDIVLSEKQLQKYSYIEFVAATGNKIIKLNEISDEPLTVILEPEFFIKKPAIYLYPTQKMQITVSHSFKGQILNTYPVYADGWKVIADQDGTLFNVNDNRNYKYLFWEGAYSFPKEHYQYKDGFYVAKENYVPFLQAKLTHIGLNENEINDFIVYWLPVMTKYPYCFVHFRINDDIDGSSNLATKPVADTTIRVFMEFSGMDEIKNIDKLPEQQLPTFIRNGFTLVEWGGGEAGMVK